MCRESINGDNIFVASAFEPEKKVKDEAKVEDDDMLEVGQVSGFDVYGSDHRLRQDLETKALGGMPGKTKGKGKGRAMDLDDDDEPVILPHVSLVVVHNMALTVNPDPRKCERRATW